MTDGDALLSAIRANPEDDTPRLVYADWLQENGQADRAEFVRVQVELAPYPNASDTPQPGHMTPTSRWLQLRAREKELLAAHETAWRRAGPCPACGPVRARMPAFEVDMPCVQCHGTGDAGGLLRTFAYTPHQYREDGTDCLVAVRWERGFPDMVEVPTLGDLIDTRTTWVSCVRCKGRGLILDTGSHGYNREYVDCPTCQAQKGCTVTDQLPTPWLAALVAHHPVEQVVPLDREPYHVLDAPSHWAHFFNGSDFYRWWCYRPVGSHPPEHERAIVPERIYEMVKGEHSTRTDAVAALGRAVVTWAKRGAVR